ncbi:MAG: nuclease-related domain-containing protein [Verrucomicrobiales bacterium]|nr:nuclease-related domain-containing protein [Verrucomicrobiales bacterium]
MPKGKKSPLKDKPLRNPGDSVQQALDNEIDDHFMPYLLMVAGTLLFAIWDWIRWHFPRPLSPWFMTVFAALTIAYCAFRIWQRLPRLRAMQQGRDGEKAVGQYLERLRATGAVVMHDIPGDNFNIDHVVLSVKGIYMIETKTISKPASGPATIDVSDEGISFAGGKARAEYFDQVAAQTRWLRSLLLESTGKELPCKPVLLFPGWFMNPRRTKKFDETWILEPKGFPKFLQNEPARLSKDDVYLAAYHLSRYSRTI